jgi:hypothetical protein
MIKHYYGLSVIILSMVIIGTMRISDSAATTPKATISGTVNSIGDCTWFNGNPQCTGVLMPVPGCTVTVTMPGTHVQSAAAGTAITDNNGNYSIDSITVLDNVDTFRVTASAGPGYSVGRQNVVLSASQAKTANFILEISYTNRGIITNDSLWFTVTTDKMNYSPGDSIYVRYSLQNVTKHAIQYWYTPGCDFDLLFKETSGDTLYRLSKNRVCPTWMIDGSIAADSSVSNVFAGVPATSAMDSIVIVTASATTVSFGKTQSSININIKKEATSIGMRNPLNKQNISGNSLILFAGKKLMLTLGSSERISMSLYTLSGGKLAQPLLNQYLAAGEYSIDLAEKIRIAEGAAVVCVKGETFSLTKVVHVRMK